MARPRSERAHDQVLDAAITLFADRGIDATSMDAIAEASGVSKATIYKHWPDKEALCLEVVNRQFRLCEQPPAFDSGDTRTDLQSLLRYQPSEKKSEEQNRMMPHLMAYAARNPSFAKTWRGRIMEPIRTQAIAILTRAITKGELPPDLDLNLSVALLVGPMMYRHVLSLLNVTMPEDMADGVVSAFWRAHALEPRPMPAPSHATEQSMRP